MGTQASKGVIGLAILTNGQKSMAGGLSVADSGLASSYDSLVVSGMRGLIRASNNFSMSVAPLSVGEYCRERRKHILVVHDRSWAMDSATGLKLAAVVVPRGPQMHRHKCRIGHSACHAILVWRVWHANAISAAIVDLPYSVRKTRFRLTSFFSRSSAVGTKGIFCGEFCDEPQHTSLLG